MKRLAIDLTPLLPGGDNGGAKPLAIELVRRLSAARPACELVLLTNEKSDAELSVLDAPNVRRLCVTRPENAPTISHRRALEIRALLVRVLPEAAVRRIGEWYAGRADAPPPATPLLRQIGAEVLFCPFTGALFYDPSVPLVSLVHDLQYLYYPEFFDPADRAERDRHFRQVCRVAARVVCVSEFTRASVLEHSDLPAGRVIAIQSAPQRRLRLPEERVQGRYLLYPANFWRHKNHEMLLIAFGMYRAAHPQSDLKLVLTGAPSPRREELREAARRMGLEDRVVFPGYLPDIDFAALLAGCRAMIFPSIFEGFGMPVLEAMAAGVPVLASDRTSLPEIAGDAALLFDPRRPDAIVEAIERLEGDPAVRAGLIERGLRRAAEFQTPDQWAARYWEVFDDALQRPVERAAGIYGVYADSWTADRITVVFGAGSAPRRLAVKLLAPQWLPSKAIDIRTPAAQVRIPRGQRQTITLDLPAEAGAIELLCSPIFRPGGEDHRELGCILEAAEIEGTPLPREMHAA